jgi:hypothetical protein
MIQIQLRPRGSHRHIVPVVVLYLLVIAFCDPGRPFEQDSWLTAAAGLSIVVVCGITFFYAGMLSLYLTSIKESWFGLKFFTLSVPPTTLRQAVVFAGICLTYFGFVCRVWIISGLEAVFLVLLAAAAAGDHFDLSAPPSWLPCLFPFLVVVIAMVHTLVERRNLGKAGLNVQEHQGGWF